MTHRHADIDTWARRQAAAARAAWADSAEDRQWTVWVRLSFGHAVSEERALGHVRGWAARLREAVPGAAAHVGLHTDTSALHAHALVFIPRRVADPFRPVGWNAIRPDWRTRLRWWAPWGHGEVWATDYDSGKREESGRGAAYYASRFPHLVQRFGTAPPLLPPLKRNDDLESR